MAGTYRRIMVPLDGSRLAECVLPHALAMARTCDSPKVVLVRVVESVSQQAQEAPPPAGLSRLQSARMAQAEDYLRQVANKLDSGSAAFETHCLEGRAAEALADYAAKNGIDLLVMATHGRTGVSRWAWGSVADRLLRALCIPILMVRVPGCLPAA